VKNRFFKEKIMVDFAEKISNMDVIELHCECPMCGDIVTQITWSDYSDEGGIGYVCLLCHEEWRDWREKCSQKKQKVM
jgi:formate dehydrogenase maturation protein FdhE